MKVTGHLANKHNDEFIGEISREILELVQQTLVREGLTLDLYGSVRLLESCWILRTRKNYTSLIT